jgi:hypothetical protein
MARGQGSAGCGGVARGLSTVRRVAIIVHGRRDALAALAHERPGEVEVVLVSAPGAAAYAGVGFLHALGELVGRDIVVDCGEDAGLALGGLRTGLRRILFRGVDDVRGRLSDIAAQMSARILAPDDLPGEILPHPWGRLPERP